MSRYIALIDRTDKAYGASFPDLPGCTAMGTTIDEVMRKAVLSVAEWVKHSQSAGLDIPDPSTPDDLLKDAEVAEMVERGAVMAMIPLLVESGRSVRANLSFDTGLLSAIDNAADIAGVTRSAFLADAAIEKIKRVA